MDLVIGLTRDALVTARFGTLLAAVHTLVVALLGASAVHGLLRPKPGAIVRYLAISAILVIATVGGLRLFFAATWTGGNRGAELLERLQPIRSTWRATPRSEVVTPPPEDASAPLLQRIRERGRLRVGFREFLPLAFFHAKVEDFDAFLFEAMASFLSGWIELKRKDGTLQALYDHWVLGLDADARGPRWSVIRDVLHWVD